MRRIFSQYSALVRMSVKESARQPVFLILAASSTALTALLPLLVTQTLGESSRLVRDSALAIHLVSGLLLGGLLAGASLRREIQRGTAASIMSKPVGPELFFIAKYSGLALVLMAYSLCSLLTILLGMRILHDPYYPDLKTAFILLGAIPTAFVLAGLDNYFTKRPFCAKAFWLLLGTLTAAFGIVGFMDPSGGSCVFGTYYSFNVIPASVLTTLAVLVLTGICLSLASVFDVVPTLSIAVSLFFAGLVSDYLFGRQADTSQVAAFLYHILPNWQHFWGADAVEAGHLPWSYVQHAAFYALLHLAGWLTLGMVALRHLEWKT